MSGQQSQQPPPAASGPSPNPFRPASLQHRFSFQQDHDSRKRAADVSLEDSPQLKQAISETKPYVQDCQVADCVHVVVNVGKPPVKFILCKGRLQHESKYFRREFGSDNNFKEEQNLTINLVGQNPETFLLYIKSIFPTCTADHEPLPVKKTIAGSDKMSITIIPLSELFRCIAKYGSLSNSNVKARVLKTLRLLRETAAELPWSQKEKMSFLTYFSKFNMDQDREILEELHKMDFEIDDVDIMKEIKGCVLHPIIATATEKWRMEKKELKNVLQCATTLEMYCQRCDKLLPILKGEEWALSSKIKCPICNLAKIVVRKKVYV